MSKPRIEIFMSWATIGMLISGCDAIGQVEFDDPIQTHLGTAMREAVTADMNRDGILDLVGAGPVFREAPRILVALGDGAGGFGGGFALDIREHVLGRVLAEDVNGDYVPDLVYVASVDVQTSLLGVLTSNSDGTYTEETYEIPGKIRGHAVGHLDEDSHVDVAFVREEVSGESETGLVVLRNVGDGTFVESFVETVDVRAYMRDISLGDMNGDGAIDIVIADHDGMGGGTPGPFLNVMINNGRGEFVARLDPHVGSTSGRPKNLSLADLDNDGDLDAIRTVVTQVTFDKEWYALDVLLNDGDGILLRVQRVDLGVTHFIDTLPIRSRDFDGDGDLELLTIDVDSPLVLEKLDGDTRFTLATRFADGADEIFVSADMTADGLPDVVLRDAAHPKIVHVYPSLSKRPRPSLEQTSLVRGETTEFRVTGLDPDTRVAILFGLTIPTPTPGVARLGGISLDIDATVMGLIAVRPVDETGVAIATVRVSASVPVTDLTTQAVGRTNGVIAKSNYRFDVVR